MNEPVPPGDEPPSGPDPEFYSKQQERLTAIAEREFGLGSDAAGQLAYDIVLSFVRHAGRISHPAAWLDGAMRAAGKRISAPRGQR
jgi:hypothetical protein